MDVISILRKKRQVVTRYEVRASGQQVEAQPAVFSRVDVVHVVEGAVEVEALRRAITLSATRYCAVGGTLSTGVTAVHHAYELRAPDGNESTGEVIVTGPHEDPAALGAKVEMVAAAAR